MRAGTRVNVEQASKRAMRGPTHLRNGEGRRGSERRGHPFGPAGVVTLARMEGEEGSNMGSPVGGEARTEPEARESQSGPTGWRRGL